MAVYSVYNNLQRVPYLD